MKLTIKGHPLAVVKSVIALVIVSEIAKHLPPWLAGVSQMLSCITSFYIAMFIIWAVFAVIFWITTPGMAMVRRPDGTYVMTSDPDEEYEKAKNDQKRKTDA